jgi:Mor family transcriptional regulator
VIEPKLNMEHAQKLEELLPASVRELAEHIGLDFALRVVEKLGIARIEWLGEVLGEDVAAAFVRHYGGSRGFYIPRCQAAVAAMQDLSIQKRFDNLSEQGLSARTIVAMLAVEFSLTDKTIWRALTRVPGGEKKDGGRSQQAGQLPLPL